jgi:hypothetical protein
LLDRGIGNLGAASRFISESNPEDASAQLKSARRRFVRTEKILSELAPPKSYGQMHNHIEKATKDYFIRGVDLCIAGIRTRDVNSVSKGTDLILKADRELFKAHDELKQAYYHQRTRTKPVAASEKSAKGGTTAAAAYSQPPGIDTIRLGDSRKTVDYKLNGSKYIGQHTTVGNGRYIELLGKRFNIGLTFNLASELTEIQLATIFRCTFPHMDKQRCYKRTVRYIDKLVEEYAAKYGEPTFKTDKAISKLFSPLLYTTEGSPNSLLAKWIVHDKARIVMDIRADDSEIGSDDHLIYFKIRISSLDQMDSPGKGTEGWESEEELEELRQVI